MLRYKHSLHWYNTDTITGFSYSLHRNKKPTLSSSLSRVDAVRMRNDISPDSSLDGEFEFDHGGDSDEEDSEMDEKMGKVVKDELSDSGYGQGLEDQNEQKKVSIKDKPQPRHRRGRNNSTAEKMNAIAGADALLELANSAVMPLQSSNSASSSPVPLVS